jgi:hypothetical protein
MVAETVLGIVTAAARVVRVALPVRTKIAKRLPMAKVRNSSVPVFKMRRCALLKMPTSL